jgi:hypothetical protein
MSTIHDAFIAFANKVIRSLVAAINQLAALGTKVRARLGWPFYGREIFILKIMMIHEVTTV